MFRDFHHMKMGGPLGQTEKFLLGRLPDTEADALRDRLFADEGLLDELEAAERDLLDAYARGELSGADKRDVEERLLGPELGREKLRFARAFGKKRGLRQWVPWAIAAMLFVSVGAGVWYAMSVRQTDRIVVARVDHVEPVAEQAFVLTPVRRGGLEPVLSIDRTVGRVRFDLATEAAEGARVRVVFTPAIASDGVVRTVEGQRYVSISVSAKELAAGSYSISADGVVYPFRVK